MEQVTNGIWCLYNEEYNVNRRFIFILCLTEHTVTVSVDDTNEPGDTNETSVNHL